MHAGMNITEHSAGEMVIAHGLQADAMFAVVVGRRSRRSDMRIAAYAANSILEHNIDYEELRQQRSGHIANTTRRRRQSHLQARSTQASSMQAD